jgi:predicted small secreted protein
MEYNGNVHKNNKKIREDLKMNMKKLLAVILAGLMLCAALTACGEDLEGKKKEIQDKYAELVELNNDLTGAINILQDAGFEINESAVFAYNEAADFINEFGEIDMKDMKADELKDLLDSANILIKSVNDARAALSAEMDELNGAE